MIEIQVNPVLVPACKPSPQRCRTRPLLHGQIGVSTRATWWPILALLAMVSLGACTVVRIEGGSLEPSRTLFGVMAIQPAPARPITVVNTEGIGWVPQADGLTLGYARQTLVMLNDPKSCHAVFLIQDTVQAQGLERLFKDAKKTINELCIARWRSS